MEVPIFDLRNETERAQEVSDMASLRPEAPADRPPASRVARVSDS